MSSDSRQIDADAHPSNSQVAGQPAVLAPFAPVQVTPRWMFWLVAAIAVISLMVGVMLWQKLSTVQRILARQTADSGTQAVEARSLAKEALDVARENGAKQALVEARVAEVALQRSQLEELMQSLSRSRDENLVVDIDSTVRLAQQQAQLTGTVEPLLAALRTADQRISRAAQPRLAPVQRAIARDVERVKNANVTDAGGVLFKIDELVRAIDDLPALNGLPASTVAGASVPAPPATDGMSTPLVWWNKFFNAVRNEARQLLRVSRIDQPDAALISPEQTFFLRENLKLKLLNARLGVLARQNDSARSDLAQVSSTINRYFDPASRKTQAAATLLQQIQSQMKTAALPGVDDTLSALATAAAGR